MSEGIAYQNKDIISKAFADTFGEKSLNVYGLSLPKVVRLLPTNLPAIEANELRMDDLYELEDGSVAIIDYESDYDEKDKLKYGNYILRVLKRYNMNIRLRMVVIYTADVSPEQVNPVFEVPCMRIFLETAFLSRLNSEEIRNRLERKVLSGEQLTDSELMEFIILPLTYKGRDEKQKSVRDTIELAKKVRDESASIFLISGIVVFADKVIDSETSQKAKEWVRMTKVGRAFEEEKEQAVKEAVTKVGKAFEEEKEQAVKEAVTKVGKAFEEEKEQAVKEASEQAKAEADAKRLVDDIDRISKAFGITVEEACLKMDYSTEDYDNARELLMSLKPVAA